MSSNTSAETQSQQTKCSIDCDCTVHCKLHPNDNNPQPSAETPKEGKVAKEALPCPFCGSPAEWTKMALADGHWYLRCYECQYEMKADRRDKVIGWWNRRAPSLERENAELKARLTTVQDLLDASLVDYETHTETIKRYKDALEAVQRITKDDRPILAQIISSALSGTNE